MSEVLTYGGVLKGHTGWITALACPPTADSNIKLVSASRDKTLVAWKECISHSSEEPTAIPEKRLEGHADFVSDVALSNNGDFAVSSSWDKSLRLWNVASGVNMRKFLGHTNDVLSVAFSPDNRQIVSVGRDKKMRVWNVQAECIVTIEKDCHSEWITCVRFSPSPSNPLIVTGSCDGSIKVWSSTDYTCKHTLTGHTGEVNSIAVSPDGSLCASAGKDGKIMLWDLSRGENLYEMDCKSPVKDICFSPYRYWLCAATESQVSVYDLETKAITASCIPQKDPNCKNPPQCTCLCWSHDGNTLYTGYTDNLIRTWTVKQE